VRELRRGQLELGERNLMRAVWKNSLLGVLVVGVHSAQAQTAAEPAVTASSTRMSAQAAKGAMFTLASPGKPSAPLPSSAKQASSPHILERSGPPPDEVNRKKFEDNAGEKGGKLLLRSVPSGADIFINDLLVGRTPLLLVMAPGPYKIDMRGARDDSGHASVGVMPKATRTVEIDLNQRYPSSISLR
jgi:PEGA domain-containing protein